MYLDITLYTYVDNKKCYYIFIKNRGKVITSVINDAVKESTLEKKKNEKT